VELGTYFDYVNSGGGCKDYQGIKTGGWTFEGSGCVDGACPGADAPLFGQPEGRTDVEGCCWWGRGVIQTTGTCNFGKLNFFMGKRAADENRAAIYPSIDFCKNPNSICDPSSPPELKWVAGMFYWLNAVQPYNSGGWNYKTELKKWVDGGMKMSDTSFINGASGIVNRGCHNPPNCGTGELHAGPERLVDDFSSCEITTPMTPHDKLAELREPSEDPTEAPGPAPRVMSVPLLFRRLFDRSTGFSNDSLVEHLRESGAITKPCIEAAFRAVDRGKFLPSLEDGTSEVYDDAPVRFGHFHMSQPSLYAEALANLELKKGLSFLNIGAGTGYLSSIVSEITGPALHHGVDVFSDLLSHAEEMFRDQGKDYIEFFEVNAHDLDLVMSPRYDRMYLGACAGGQSKRLLALLQVGGIAVGPFETSSGQYIRRVLRKSETLFEVKNLKQVSFGRLLNSEEPRRPRFVLPSPPWTPATHASHSAGFKAAVREVLLCTTHASSPAHIVPRDVFVKQVFGFVHPRWFSEVPGRFWERLDGTEQPMEDEGTYDEDSARLQVLRTLATFARQQRDLEAQESDVAMQNRIQSLFRMLNPLDQAAPADSPESEETASVPDAAEQEPTPADVQEPMSDEAGGYPPP
ncbi:unnamed protein product, partial [Effrenium voratum]